VNFAQVAWFSNNRIKEEEWTRLNALIANGNAYQSSGTTARPLVLSDTWQHSISARFVAVLYISLAGN
jgi:hypothetical protein